MPSHYGRKKSNRKYLSSLHSIRGLWLKWKEEYLRENPNGRCVTYKQFHIIFVTKFNIGFGLPRTDACSTCVKYENEKKLPERAKEAELQHKLHLLRAKQFYRFKKVDAERHDTLTLCFDLQQNLPLPLTSIGEAFYCRQLWFHNFAVVNVGREQSPKNVWLYSWLETQAGRGSNEIISALMNYLDKKARSLQRRYRYRHLSLYSDACPGQNRNFSMLFALLCYINSSNCPFKTI